MRIVFINPVAEFGGAERSLLSWMGAVRCALPGARLHLICPGEGLLAARAREAGAEVHVMPIPARIAELGDSALRGGNRLASAWRLGTRAAAALPAVGEYVVGLRRALQRLRPSLVHSNGIKTHLLVRLSGWNRGPVVWHLHDFIGHRPVVARALRWASARVSAAVAVSEAVAHNARATLPQTVIRTVYNVTDPLHFSPGPGDGAALDALAGLPPAAPGTVRVALVATFARWKGQDVFLQAAARVLQKSDGGARGGPPARFYIVGGAIYRTHGSQWSEAELRGLAGTLGIEPHVGFVAFQKDPAGVYRAADVVVHASTQPEPFGLTVIESMACGRATVVARAGGAAELIDDGADAIGVTPGDPAALADVIRNLVDDPECRAALGRRARESVLRRFNPRDLPARVLSVYAPLLRLRGRGGEGI